MMTIQEIRPGREPIYVSRPILIIEKYFLIHRVQCFAHLVTGEYYNTCACGRRFTTPDRPNLTDIVNPDTRCNSCWVTHRHNHTPN